MPIPSHLLQDPNIKREFEYLCRAYGEDTGRRYLQVMASPLPPTNWQIRKNSAWFKPKETPE